MRLTDKQRAARILKRQRAEQREETASILREIARITKAEPLRTQRNIRTAVYKAIRSTNAREFAKHGGLAKERGLIPVSLSYGRKAWVTRAIARRMAEEYPWLPSDDDLKAIDLANPQ